MASYLSALRSWHVDQEYSRIMCEVHGRDMYLAQNSIKWFFFRARGAFLQGEGIRTWISIQPASPGATAEDFVLKFKAVSHGKTW